MITATVKAPLYQDITSGPNGTFHLLKQGLLDASLGHRIPGLEVARGTKIVLLPPNPDEVDSLGRQVFQKIRIPAFGTLTLADGSPNPDYRQESWSTDMTV